MMDKLDQIDKLLQDIDGIDNRDLNALYEQAIGNPDEDKRKAYNALYIYFLDKKQRELIKRKDFIR